MSARINLQTKLDVLILYFMLVPEQCFITDTKRNKNWNKTDTRRRTKMHITMFCCYTHWTTYNKHIIKWTNLPEKLPKLLIANFTYYHPPDFKLISHLLQLKYEWYFHLYVTPLKWTVLLALHNTCQFQHWHQHQNHVIYLNNHLNMMNATILLMATSAVCDRENVFVDFFAQIQPHTDTHTIVKVVCSGVNSSSEK